MNNPNQLDERPLNAYLYLLTTMAFFGSAFASSKAVVEHVPHQVAAVLRFGGGALILALLLLFFGRKAKGLKLTRGQLVRAASVGLLGVFAYNLFFFWGLSLAPSIDGSIIVPVLSPVITTAILLAFGKETASPARIGGLALGVVGAVVFFFGAGGAGVEADGSRMSGDLFFFLGALAWALYSIASKKVLKGMDPLRATTFGTLAGAVALLVFSVPSLPETNWADVPGTAWANVVYLAIGPTAVAYLFYYRGLRMVSPSAATMIMFTVPVFGVTCAVVFLGESFSGLQAVGAVLMLAGALFAVAQPRTRRKRRTASPGDAAEVPEESAEAVRPTNR